MANGIPSGSTSPRRDDLQAETCKDARDDGAPQTSADDGAPEKTGRGRRRAEKRLSRGDWIAAGQDILRKQGVAGVKLAALTRSLGVSTGSFYHHFSDFEDYLTALADSYSMERVQGVLNRTSFDDPDPLARVRELARLSVVEGTFELDRAMRIWATMDPRAVATVRRAEEAVLAFLTDAFTDLGFDRDEAEFRSRVLMSVNIAPLQAIGPADRRRFFKMAMDLLAAKPAAKSPSWSSRPA